MARPLTPEAAMLRQHVRSSHPPFLKAVVLLIILTLKNQAARYRLYLMVRSLSKWAMADVFAVGVFIAMLAAQGTDNLDGIPGPGFYFFAAYCLVSNLAFQLLKIPPPSSRELEVGS